MDDKWEIVVLHLPDPVFNDSLCDQPSTLSDFETVTLAALCMASILFAIVVTAAICVKLVYGLPGATLKFAFRRQTTAP